MNIFYITDIKNYIFSFLRKNPKVECFDCKKTLVWDKKVNDYVQNPYPVSYINQPGNYFCIQCWQKNFIGGCDIV